MPEIIVDATVDFGFLKNKMNRSNIYILWFILVKLRLNSTLFKIFLGKSERIL